MVSLTLAMETSPTLVLGKTISSLSRLTVPPGLAALLTGGSGLPQVACRRTGLEVLEVLEVLEMPGVSWPPLTTWLEMVRLAWWEPRAAGL